MGSSNNDIGLGEISALLAALGIAIYALGMVTLCWPIYWRITQNASTALYAVSLMPKTVVAGQGVRLVFGIPVVVSALWVAGAIVQRIILNIYGQLVEGYGVWVDRGGVALISVVFVVLLLVVVRRMRPILNAFETRGTLTWASILAIVLALVVGVITALVVNGVFFESGAILPQWPGWVTIVKTVTLIILLNCVSTFVLALTSDPPLPEIALNGSTTAEGKLVAHVDGIWYVLDNSGKLIGVPDDKAGCVLIYPN